MNVKIKEIIKNKPSQTMLVIDYDRTLVDNDKQLLKNTKEQLIKFQENGGTVVIASGRPFSGVKHICQELDMDKYNGYVIGANGAEIVEVNSQQLLQTNKIGNEQLIHALKDLEPVVLKKGVYTDTHLLVTAYTDDLRDEASSNRLQLQEADLLAHVDDSCKIVLSNTREDTHSYYEQVVECLGSNFNVVKSSPRYIEITKVGADKGLAIDYLRTLIMDKAKYIIGIGDSQNDESMLNHSHYKIAMGNATEQIKQLSDITIASNTEDGIGLFLK